MQESFDKSKLFDYVKQFHLESIFSDRMKDELALYSFNKGKSLLKGLQSPVDVFCSEGEAEDFLHINGGGHMDSSIQNTVGNHWRCRICKRNVCFTYSRGCYRWGTNRCPVRCFEKNEVKRSFFFTML